MNTYFTFLAFAVVGSQKKGKESQQMKHEWAEMKNKAK